MDKKKEKQSYAFVDCRCLDCNGEGCPKCEGTGLIGKYVPVSLEQPKQDALAKRFNKTRLDHDITLRDLAAKMGLPVSRVSALERGASRTAYEERYMKRWVKEMQSCKQER